ncbi:MAG TPA: MEDS domain-containing protein [Actinomycetota bacterium]|nr:MEDS domain-containing protein [Actinomycetota bacterium]
MDFRDPALVHLGLHASATGGERNDHFVEFYDSDRSVVDSARTFISMGLSEGESALVVASSGHRKAIERELEATVDLARARSKGLYSSFDAKETLALFMREGRPDPVQFERVVEKLLARAMEGGRKVRVFGEMVAILWGQGNVAAAIELEELWNRVLQASPFRLFCAYPMDVFEDGDPDSIGALFHTHSQVVVPRSEPV